MPASSVRAVFSCQALMATSCVRANNSLALTARSSVSRRRTSAMPMSFSVAMAETPSSSIRERPVMNAWNAAAGSASNSDLKPSAVRPDTRAKSSSASPPVAAATSILTSALENAEPPISASMPTDDSAAAKPRICASDSPT